MQCVVIAGNSLPQHGKVIRNKNYFSKQFDKLTEGKNPGAAHRRLQVQCLPEEVPEPQITVGWESRLGKVPQAQASYPAFFSVCCWRQDTTPDGS